MSKITCFGEVLWDVFPSYKKIGGAPLNVASRLQSFNHDVSIISAIGQDESGADTLQYLKECGIDTSCVQEHNAYKTGKVKVTLNKEGVASYDIKYPRAWDKIRLTKMNKNAVENADAFIFGSLAARDDSSRNTLCQLIDRAKYKIFDLNLRPPFYTKDILTYLMDKADFIKFNDDELYEVSRNMGATFNSLEQNLRFIANKTNTKHLCVTKGAHGAILLYNDKLYYNKGFLVKVIDTVGAGDSFLAALISQLLNKKAPQKAIDFACAVGALVAQREGANPKISDSEIMAFVKSY
ncbi:carbohydrate kinase family protein [Snuella sedimenti]|uniref:Carbohydrate kinase n=1 Tax=Snuella sedimenti TaxID=2798802 RepID=A0A8J7J198_9FLAO|nr:carbohydrate kinase [Snuella sedimenti]MBJ6367792.1 carbohydrate kinase [Snuella sedimenti]